MPKTIFESKLLDDGHLYCPEEFAKAEARYEVIVTLPFLDGEEGDNETALLSEEALAKDWSRKEEDEAWSHLQPDR